MKSDSHRRLCFSRRSSKGSSLVTLLCASIHPSICPEPQDLPIIDFIQGCHVANLSRRNAIKAIWSGEFVAVFQSLAVDTNETIVAIQQKSRSMKLMWSSSNHLIFDLYEKMNFSEETNVRLLGSFSQYYNLRSRRFE